MGDSSHDETGPSVCVEPEAMAVDQDDTGQRGEPAAAGVAAASRVQSDAAVGESALQTSAADAVQPVHTPQLQQPVPPQSPQTRPPQQPASPEQSSAHSPTPILPRGELQFVPRCGHRHPLKRVLCAIGAASNEPLVCDGDCDRIIPNKDPRWSCLPCDFDICERCLLVQGGGGAYVGLLAAEEKVAAGLKAKLVAARKRADSAERCASVPKPVGKENVKAEKASDRFHP